MSSQIQIPDNFQAIIAKEPGDANVLHCVTRSMPEPQKEEVLIEVCGAGVNRPDIVQREGKYPPPPGASDILGLEISGTIVKTGQNSTPWKAGDKVCALIAGGGYAQYALAPVQTLLSAPACLPLSHAAVLPETIFTVWANVFDSARLRRGETLLVHGGTSGIGSTAIQMTKAAGARVIATSRTQQKCEQCLHLGADLAVNTSKPSWVDEVKAYGGVDVILDMVAGDFVTAGLSLLNKGGRMVFVAFLGGSKVQIDLRALLVKQLTLCGSTLRPRSLSEKARLRNAIKKTVWLWIEQGRFTPVIDSEFDLKEATKAHEHMQSGEHFGKILLRP